MKQLYVRSYFAAVVRVENDVMLVKPQSGDTALAENFYELLCQLGEPGPGSLIAVWDLNESRPDHDTVANACTLVQPSGIYMMGADRCVYRLSSSALEDLIIGAPS